MICQIRLGGNGSHGDDYDGVRIVIYSFVVECFVDWIRNGTMIHNDRQTGRARLTHDTMYNSAHFCSHPIPTIQHSIGHADETDRGLAGAVKHGILTIFQN